MKTLVQNYLKLGLLCSAVFMAGCDDNQEEVSENVRTVKTFLVSDEAVANLKTFSGVSRSAQESKLSFKVPGTIMEVPVKVGDKVSAGTVIASIEPSAYRLQLQQAQASVTQSKANARNARSAYERKRSLYANNNISLGDLDTSRANTETANAQLKVAQKSLQLADLNLSYTKLSLDVDCVVDSIAVSVNENVSTNTEVARVNCSDDLEIEIALPEGLVDDVDNGSVAEVRFDAIADRVFHGKVIEVGLAANGTGSTFPVTVLIEDKGPKIRAGLAASVTFKSKSKENLGYVVPLSALVKQSDGTCVYTVTSQNKGSGLQLGEITKRTVKIGDLQSAGVEILEGLQSGDRVVTAGVSFLREGLQVSYIAADAKSTTSISTGSD